MDNQENAVAELAEIHIISKSPFYKRKMFLIFSGIFCLILISIIIWLFFMKAAGKNSASTNFIAPTPSENFSNGIAWQVDIAYNSSSNIFTIESLRLIPDTEKVDKKAAVNSPYSISILSKNKDILYSSKVLIATNIIIPPEFIGTRLERDLKNKPIQSSFQIPYLKDAYKLQLSSSQGIILEAEFPSENDTTINLIQQFNNQPTKYPPIIPTKTQDSNVFGWNLSAESFCEDGKVFVRYNYFIPYPAVIITFDYQDPYPGSLSTWDDISWKGNGQNLQLIGGSGEYIAKANTIESDWTGPVIEYNGPVGFLKGRIYAGEMGISGDWTCDYHNDYSRPGCVSGEQPSGKELDSFVRVVFRTPDTETCPDITKTPEQADNNIPQLTCKPDSSCSSNFKALQICTLVCGYN